MEFKNKDIESKYLERVENIKRLIDAPVDDAKYLWDETARLYAVKIEQIKRVLSGDTLSKDSSEAINLAKELKNFLERCSSPEFQIALVGTIKAGKSTLINALLNYELASTRATPETAALTKFKRSDVNFVQISFYNEDEWNALWASANNSKSKENIFLEEYNAHNADNEKVKWLGSKEQKVECDDLEKLKDEIGKWTSSKSACHYFVKEVLVGLKDINLPDGVVLVDTPGLDDVVEFRSNITREYIEKADAVFVCSKPDGFTGRTMMTLTKVLDRAHDNIEKVYMIVTQIDTINNPKKTWENDLQKEWVKYLKGESKYRSEDLAKRNLIPVSAYLYTMLHEYQEGRLKEEDDRYFDLTSTLLKLRVKEDQLNDHFDELITFTNIKFLENKLNTEIIAKRKDIQMQGINADYKSCLNNISAFVDKERKEQENLIATSKQGIESIRMERDKAMAEYKEAQSEKRKLDNLVKTLKDATTKRIEEVLASIHA